MAPEPNSCFQPIPTQCQEWKPTLIPIIFYRYQAQIQLPKVFPTGNVFIVCNSPSCNLLKKITQPLALISSVQIEVETPCWIIKTLTGTSHEWIHLVKKQTKFDLLAQHHTFSISPAYIWAPWSPLLADSRNQKSHCFTVNKPRNRHDQVFNWNP